MEDKEIHFLLPRAAVPDFEHRIAEHLHARAEAEAGVCTSRQCGGDDEARIPQTAATAPALRVGRRPAGCCYCCLSQNYSRQLVAWLRRFPASRSQVDFR